MRHDPEMPFPLRVPLRGPDRSRFRGDVDTVPVGLWVRRPAHLSRWGLRDAALAQLSLAALTWALVAWIIRWSLSW